jgi:hypothetical protein
MVGRPLEREVGALVSLPGSIHNKLVDSGTYMAYSLDT